MNKVVKSSWLAEYRGSLGDDQRGWAVCVTNEACDAGQTRPSSSTLEVAMKFISSVLKICSFLSFVLATIYYFFLADAQQAILCLVLCLLLKRFSEI